MKKLLATIAVTALMGIGCSTDVSKSKNLVPTDENSVVANQTATEKTENLELPLKYDLGDVDAVLRRSVVRVERTFTKGMLAYESEKCGTNLTDDHFAEVLSKFTNQRGHRYTFTLNGDLREPNRYTLTAFANGPAYANMEAFKRDFDICGVGSLLYPLALNRNWLVFESGCGSGVDDGSGRPTGCEVIREQIRKTLEIR